MKVNLIIRNTFLLGVSQGASYLIPLVTMPYLARVLGVDQFGLLGIVSNVLANLTTFTDWGFRLSATREIARNSRDAEKIRTIFWATMGAKAFLVILSFVATLAIMIFSGFTSLFSYAIMAGWLQLVSSLIGVGWFLQGLERMGPMVIADLLGRFLSVPLIFFFVRTPADTVWAVVIAGLSGLISGSFSFYFALRARPLWPVRISFEGVLNQLYNGWHIFVSISATSLYTQLNVIILGAFAGPAQAGLLFGAEKLQKAAKSLTVPLASAMYPRVNSLLSDNPSRAIYLVRRLLVVQASMSLFFAVLLFVFSPYVTILFLGSDYAGAVHAVRWLSGTVFLVGVSGVLGVQVMLPFGMQKEFMRTLVGAGLFNVLSIMPLCYYYGATGAAIAVFSTELGVTVVMSLVVWRSKVLNFI